MDGVTTVEIPKNIGSALAKASKETGTNFDYLLQTAMRESSFNKDAKASRSTATGLFQFIESTWLQTLKEEGARLGLKKLSSQISKNSFGNYVVSNPETKAKILDLRKDPEISAMVAAAYAQKNENYIETRIGRKPSSGEVYIAHFLGARDAAKLIQLTNTQPHARADKYFAAAAEKNPNVFFEKGKVRSVSAVYNTLVQGYDGTVKQGALSTDEATGSWHTTISKGNNVKPLIKRGDFKAGDTGKEGAGSIGAWVSLVGEQNESDAKSKSKVSKGKFSEIYSSSK